MGKSHREQASENSHNLTRTENMKFLSTALTATLGLNLNRQPRAGTREIGFEGSDKRYAQLKEMFTTYNPLFDGTCKQYKDCNKCAQEQFGDTCIQEFTAYSFTSATNSIQCTDEPNSCKRALCECDSRFANEHAKKTNPFDASYHSFESNWDPTSSCSAGTRGIRHDPKCCSNSDTTSPFSLYNHNYKECCSDGKVQAIGQC